MNKILVFLLFSAFIFQGCGTSETTEAVVVYSAEELQAAAVNDNADIIELADDIQLIQTLEVSEGTKITIDGNGHTIHWPYDDAPAIEIAPYAALQLIDITMQGLASIDTGTGGIIVASGGSLTLGEGSVVTGFADSGIVVNGGRLVIDGGTVAQNGGTSSFGIGGGINLLSGELVMYDGEIHRNSSRTAGGIFVIGPAHIELHGGQIHRNHAEAGGGIFLEPPNPYWPHVDQTITIKIGQTAGNMIFNNNCGRNFRHVEGGPGIQGTVINDLADFLYNFEPSDNIENLILILSDEN